LSAVVVVVLIHRTTVLANYLVREPRREE
jgi:hypothetical protein